MNPVFVDKPGFNYHQSTQVKAPMAEHSSIVPVRTFEEYKDRHAPAWQLERTEDGIMTAKWWTEGEEMLYGTGAHRGWGQLLQDVYQDPDTELLILGGYGNTYLNKGFPNMVDERANMPWWSYEHMYYDGTTFIEALINLRIPTIGIINGNAPHSELAMMCDITLMADDVEIFDPHFLVGGIPGDGIQIALQHIMGTKRAAYAMLTCERIDAAKALELGMVNEVVPREKLWNRAMELAKEIMKKDRIARRLTSEICKDPWREPVAKYLRANFGREMWSFFTDMTLDHTESNKVLENSMPDLFK